MTGARSILRENLIGHVAKRIAALPRAGTPLVAIDGVDGSGKTAFADELAPAIECHGRPVMRAGIDGFHNPRAVRYRMGRSSPLGYFLDSYDYDSLRRHLLEPLAAGKDMVETARFDYRTDQVVESAWRRVEPDTVLILDGIFLHRDELSTLWSLSVFLDVPFEISFARMAARDSSPADPHAESNRRYLEGQKLYLDRCRPRERANIVIDNAVLEAPTILVERR